jgi:hypothetical protein
MKVLLVFSVPINRQQGITLQAEWEDATMANVSSEDYFWQVTILAM